MVRLSHLREEKRTKYNKTTNWVADKIGVLVQRKVINVLLFI